MQAPRTTPKTPIHPTLVNHPISRVRSAEFDHYAYELIRVSTDKQDVLRQQRENARVAAKYRIKIIGTLELTGVSGKDMPNHAQVQELLVKISDPECDGLIVPAVDRIYRPTELEHFEIGKTFRHCRKPIWTNVDGVLELWTDDGFAKFIELGMIAKKERDRIRQRTMSGKREKITDAFEIAKLDGMTPAISHAVPYGYKFVPRDRINDMPPHMVIHDEERIIVLRIFQWARQGIKCHTIAAMLNAEGVKSKRAGKVDVRGRDGSDGGKIVAERINDGKWSKQTVYQLLTDTHYLGYYLAFAGTDFETKCFCPALVEITFELWQSVQVILEDNKNTPGPDGAKWKWLLTTLGRCKFCGERLMSHRSGNGKTGYYLCSKKSKPPAKAICTGPLPWIRQELLEPAVFESVWATFTDGDTLVRLIEAAHANAEPDPLALKEVAEIEANLAKLRRNVARALENLNDSDIPREQTKPVYTKAVADVRNAEYRLTQAKAAARPKLTMEHDPDAIRAMAKRLKTKKPQTFEQKREWLLGIVMEFRTDAKVVEIECAVPQELLGDDADLVLIGKRRLALIGKRHQHAAFQLTHSNSFKIQATLSA